MMRIFAIYFIFLSIIMAGCTSSITEPFQIDAEGLGVQDEAMKDLEHKRNIEELELQQSEFLEGLPEEEEETIAESLSEVADDSEQDTNEVADAEAGDESNLLAQRNEEDYCCLPSFSIHNHVRVYFYYFRASSER